MRVCICSCKTKYEPHRVVLCVSKINGMAQCHNRKPCSLHSFLRTGVSECHSFCNNNICTEFIDQMNHCLHVCMIKASFFHQWLRYLANGLLPILCFFLYKNTMICKNIIQHV